MFKFAPCFFLKKLKERADIRLHPARWVQAPSFIKKEVSTRLISYETARIKRIGVKYLKSKGYYLDFFHIALH
jgi:hypothetical protein